VVTATMGPGVRVDANAACLRPLRV